jgi:hypothetical protein
VRSTTFVFKVLCTSIKKFGVFRVETQSHRHIDGQSAAAPRRRAHRTCAPHRLGVRAHVPPKATRRLRCAFPMRRTPRLLGVLPGPGTPPPAPYWPGARHGPLVRQRHPSVRTPTEAGVPRPHIRGHTVVIPAEPPL